MDRDFTPLSVTSEFAALVRQAVCGEKTHEPRETTLQYLKAVARTLKVKKDLPRGIQEYMLS